MLRADEQETEEVHAEEKKRKWKGLDIYTDGDRGELLHPMSVWVFG